MQPAWRDLSSPWSLKAWEGRFGWVDPITLAIKDGLPFTEQIGSEFIVFAPVVWLSVALALWWYGRMSARPQEGAVSPAKVLVDEAETGRNLVVGAPAGSPAWLVLAAVLLAAGITSPDSLGPGHGEFLPGALSCSAWRRSFRSSRSTGHDGRAGPSWLPCSSLW